MVHAVTLMPLSRSSWVHDDNNDDFIIFCPWVFRQISEVSEEVLVGTYGREESDNYGDGGDHDKVPALQSQSPAGAGSS